MAASWTRPAPRASFHAMRIAMLSLLLLPLMAFQNAPATDVFRTSCETVHAQLGEFTRGTSTVAPGDDDDRITRTPLTHSKRIFAYYQTPASVVHIERYSYDTELYSDTIEFTLNSPFIATKSAIKVAHNFGCGQYSTNDVCNPPDILTSDSPIIMHANRLGTQSLVSCFKVRTR